MIVFQGVVFAGDPIVECPFIKTGRELYVVREFTALDNCFDVDRLATAATRECRQRQNHRGPADGVQSRKSFPMRTVSARIHGASEEEPKTHLGAFSVGSGWNFSEGNDLWNQP